MAGTFVPSFIPHRHPQPPYIPQAYAMKDAELDRISLDLKMALPKT
jgi:hypothetical protein